jgi:hypothetical protein
MAAHDQACSWKDAPRLVVRGPVRLKPSCLPSSMRRVQIWIPLPCASADLSDTPVNGCREPGSAVIAMAW